MNFIVAQLERWCFRLSAVLLISICLVIGWQVFARKVLNDSPSWSEPLALLLLLFSVMLASAAGCRTKLHLGLLWFRNQFPQRMQQPLLLLEFFVCGILGGIMAFYGWQMFAKTLNYQLPGLPVSMGLQYLPLVLGGTLIALFNAEQFFYQNSRNRGHRA